MSSQVIKDDIPITLAEIRKAIPAKLFEKSELRFLVSVAYSVSFTLVLMYLGKTYIPLNWWMLPVWILYAAVTGTVWFGVWILGHECGHGSFSNNQYLNDSLGYVLHTTFLVPYFSWQYSHSIHHSKNNHLTQNESHVPVKVDSDSGRSNIKLREVIGHDSFAIFLLTRYSMIGFLAYLGLGITGSRGYTNHYIAPNKLFPQSQATKVHLSTLGILAIFYSLYLWAQATSFAEVLAVYLGPYVVGNAWLTFITLLQHTDLDVPHYDETSWTWLKGALATIDRNYPPFIDSLHHYIGTTHVLHHIFSDLPHYNAKEANVYLKQTIGDLYHYDPKNILESLYETAKYVAVENKGNGVWKYI